jgi:hypothetical protein
LSLADCYSIAFVGVGLVYMVGHLPGVWNWTIFLVQSTFHGPHYPWNDRTRSYQLRQGIYSVHRGNHPGAETPQMGARSGRHKHA